MNGNQRCVGIDITSSKLQLVELRKENNLYLVENLGQSFISPHIDFAQLNENVFLDQIQTAFEELIIRNPIKSNIASFTLPQEIFITVQLPYDANLTQNEIREEFNWELSQLFPFIEVEDLAIKFYALNGSLLAGKRNALIVALNKKSLIVIKNFCQKNNLTPRLVDSAAISVNSFVNNFYTDKKSTIVHIFNSKNSITLFISIDAKPSYVKVFSKQDDSFVSRIISELLKENIKSVISNLSVKALLSGEDLESEIISEIGRGTELVFERIYPFETFNIRPEFQNNLIPSEQLGSFISSIAIAARF